MPTSGRLSVTSASTSASEARAFSGGDAFSVAGAPIARDAAIVEAGVDFNIAPSATLDVNYCGQIGSGVSDHGVNPRLKVQF
ncbi:autotransporter domain-containing protein [Ensifer oleiphilus]|jgi:uncharacterized protein with beta-barrel porin domain|nr:autotransporter domain-containing protein [Ensifer oleiphilus]